MNTKISLIIALFAMGVMFFPGTMTVNAEEVEKDYKGWDAIFENDYIPPDSSYNMSVEDQTIRLKLRKLFPQGSGEFLADDKSLWGEKGRTKMRKKQEVDPHKTAAFGDGGI